MLVPKLIKHIISDLSDLSSELLKKCLLLVSPETAPKQLKNLIKSDTVLKIELFD